MDIYSVICSALGADIYGGTVIRLHDLAAQPHADGGGYIKVSGDIICEGTYRDMSLISRNIPLAAGTNLPVIKAASPIRINRRADGSTQFSQGFEAILRIPTEGDG